MKVPIKQGVWKRLLEMDGEPISGQKLAEELGVSRTAIWKAVQTLQSEGFEIDSVKKSGYAIHAKPAFLTLEEMQQYRTSEQIGKYIHLYPSLTSTQVIAHEKAQHGALHGTVIVSEEQTAGRGRLQRKWDSGAGKGLWMTIILRPDIHVSRAPQLTLIAAVAVVKGIEDVTGVQAQIKWPNDVLINGKKCTGILTELQADVDRVQAVLLGIGINVLHDKEDFPEELKDIATSLKMESGEAVNRAKLAATIWNYLEKYSDLYLEQGFEPIRLLWESYSTSIGQQIIARTAREVIEGRAKGITKDGVLLVEDSTGKIHEIYSADIELTT
ncbi:biotin--[acetyl-CoA-carboxylase] ligase [Paenisporosarcina cavernae]|uniref:Bifunctional ligase/repressor BirA n=1 Tax=Paenisporosarcina cavernae TaxID=2320858 RepID=A0A385YUP6_9BACL|nr:biotin--[acetyl-CoA-carboxylase] ligase [Paenisporosarcina cavernae]AYC29408.1 biotin--[acetyl-CoA-carboxylase] ligase [Paenisporosarcina cavernae]